MPYLHDEAIQDMLAAARHTPALRCAFCRQITVQDYCRSCDEMYRYGHLPTCHEGWDQQHCGHRLTIVPFVECRHGVNTPDVEQWEREHCTHCREPLSKHDVAVSLNVHLECGFRLIGGGLAHQQHRCGCYMPAGLAAPDLDPPGLTKRQAACLAHEQYSALNTAWACPSKHYIWRGEFPHAGLNSGKCLQCNQPMTQVSPV